jgi:hypothetical protein
MKEEKDLNSDVMALDWYWLWSFPVQWNVSWFNSWNHNPRKRLYSICAFPRLHKLQTNRSLPCSSFLLFYSWKLPPKTKKTSVIAGFMKYLCLGSVVLVTLFVIWFAFMKNVKLAVQFALPRGGFEGQGMVFECCLQI